MSICCVYWLALFRERLKPKGRLRRNWIFCRYYWAVSPSIRNLLKITKRGYQNAILKTQSQEEVQIAILKVYETPMVRLVGTLNQGTYEELRKLRVRTHWTDKICFALPKFSTKFVSAKFLICQAWAHWYTAKYLLTTSFNHTKINTIACSLFARKITWDLRSHL